jgi:3-phenylpropionate/trans-cinnamate dioxygenase ferredoxin subunit
MREKKYKWHKVAESEADVHSAENGMALIEVAGKQLCLGKFNDSWFAFASKCPHAGGLLTEGYIDAVGNVVCPLHRYKFSISNGRNTSGEGYALKTYPVELRPGGLFIGLEEGGLFNWL